MSPTAPPLAGLDEVLADLETTCAEIDRGAGDLRPTLGRLAGLGLLSLGTNTAGGELADQVTVLSAVAERCMASAFGAWAHRMAIEYLDAIDSPDAAAASASLHSGERFGCTAMADAFRDLSGISPLPLTFRRVAGGIVVDGDIAWTSNLQPGALVVTVVRDADADAAATSGGTDRLVVALTVGQQGLGIRPVTDLLALDSTASGSLHLDRALVRDDQILTSDVDAFLRRVRPTFLVLQTSLGLGLARAALDAAPEPQGVSEVFREDLDSTRKRLDEAWSGLAALATTARNPRNALRPYLEARLDATHLARDAVHLELNLTGGRGYLHRSPTARRLREAAFLPVQSPTEGHLRWELSRSA